MLQVLEGRGLVNVVAVVTRYYGGTKLGVGGLVRAYAGTLASAIEQADLERVIPMRSLCLRFAFRDENRVQTILYKHGLHPENVTYSSEVNMGIRVPASRQSELVGHLENALSGNIRIQEMNSTE
jgi:putative IMPACT (imprinted ancient) family translation regulator